MTHDDYALVRAQFFCRACGARFTTDAEVSQGGTGTSYRVAQRADECGACGSDDTQLRKTWPRESAPALAVGMRVERIHLSARSPLQGRTGVVITLTHDGLYAFVRWEHTGQIRRIQVTSLRPVARTPAAESEGRA